MKTRLVQKVFVFLLITVGILYLLLRVQRATREPFVATRAEYNDCDTKIKKCQKYNLPDGNEAYFCRDGDSGDTGQLRAEDILNCDDQPSDKINPANIPALGSGNAVCYQKGTQGGSIYVCYDRPPPIYYDPNLDTYVNQNYLDDPVPGQLESLLPTTCATYQTTLSMLYNAFSKITENKQKMDSGISMMEYVKSEVQKVYNQYCSPTMPDGPKKVQCQTLNTFLTDAPITDNITKLKGIQISMMNALSNLQTYYTDDIQRGYGGLGCPLPILQKPAGLN
jgi:hypothetical protein